MLISFYLSKCMYASVVLRHEANGPISSSVQEWRPIPMQPATQHGPPQLHSSRARADIDLVPAADAISNQRRVPRAVLRQYAPSSCSHHASCRHAKQPRERESANKQSR